MVAMMTMMMMTVEMRRKSATVVLPLARRELLVVRRQKFQNTHGRLVWFILARAMSGVADLSLATNGS